MENDNFLKQIFFIIDRSQRNDDRYEIGLAFYENLSDNNLKHGPAVIKKEIGRKCVDGEMNVNGHIHTRIYIYVCVCVCVCVSFAGSMFLHKYYSTVNHVTNNNLKV